MSRIEPIDIMLFDVYYYNYIIISGKENSMENQEERIKRMIERRDRENKYRNQYTRDHYKRVTCLIPLDKVEILEQAASDAGMKTSTYIMSLVDADLKKRGLLK